MCFQGDQVVQQRILVIKHGAFGDLIQALGGLHDIRLAFPAAHITLLTAPAFKSLMQRCPHLNAIITDDRKPLWQLGALWRLRQHVKAARIDIVIDLQNSSRTNWYRRYLFNSVQWIGRLPSAPRPVSGLKGLVALLEQNQIKVHYLMQPDIQWLAADVSQQLSKSGVQKDYLLLLPGASAGHKEKRWPYYAQLAEQLQDNKLAVVVVLGPDEVGLASEFSCPVLTGLNWFELAGLIKAASYVIGNDSGPCHLASVLHKQGIALFGPTTSAARSELARGPFKTYETYNLAGLKPDTVLQRYFADMSA